MAISVPQAADDSHQRLLDQIDITSQRERIAKPGWKPSQRRNKNIKQIISESQRKEASVLASQNNSGATTPFTTAEANTGGAMTPTMPSGGGAKQTNIAQAAQSLSSLVLEKSLQRNAMPPGPAVTYTNIESAPSLHPAKKHYCDITGLPAEYRDPKTRLRYHNKEVFVVVRTLSQGVAEQYLALRGAHVVLK